MKKVFLGMLFVMITITFKANTITDSNSFTNSFELRAEEAILVDSCFDDAWGFGTFFGQGNSTLEWYYTDLFYRMMCEGEYFIE